MSNSLHSRLQLEAKCREVSLISEQIVRNEKNFAQKTRISSNKSTFIFY